VRQSAGPTCLPKPSWDREGCVAPPSRPLRVYADAYAATRSAATACSTASCTRGLPYTKPGTAATAKRHPTPPRVGSPPEGTALPPAGKNMTRVSAVCLGSVPNDFVYKPMNQVRIPISVWLEKLAPPYEHARDRSHPKDDVQNDQSRQEPRIVS